MGFNLDDSKGARDKRDGDDPNVEFCTNGNWVQQNYPNELVGGTYRVSGNRLVMEDEDGSTYVDGTMSFRGGILQADGIDYTWRYKYLGKSDCK